MNDTIRVFSGRKFSSEDIERKKEYALSRKAIFVYPLQKDFRACLKGEKPYKRVDPDEQV